MTTLVFRLRNVPDDEADAVRAVLDANRIDWYETSAGNWGIAMPGVWVEHDAAAHRARVLIDSLQRERGERLAAEHEPVSPLARLRERPAASLAIIAFCVFVLYVSINPFITLVTQSAR